MFQIDFKNPCNVYFCGIGGISMSAVAEILLDAGFHVSGSDRSSSELTERLSSNGIMIYIGQKAENITSDIDVFIYTAAIRPDHCEFAKAKELGIPMLTRAEALGQIMKNRQMPIAISGTHGKTTVTSMVSEILMAAEKDPTLLVGGILDSIGGNLRIGHSDIFVTEACEYTNSFLSFFPKASIILNVEEDHLDFFKDINDIRNSFHKFASLSPADGLVVINNDIDNKNEILNGIASKVVTFGKTADAMYYATDFSYDEEGISHFTVNSPSFGFEPMAVSLRVPGEHNVLNSLAAIAMADYLEVDRAVTLKALANFGGTRRRFEHKGEVNGITVIDDYAHHPSEIRATLKAAVEYPKKKLWVVFQPHTYTRTKAFMDDFASALSLADAVILADIYAAREKDNLGISSADLCEKIKKLGTESYYFDSFEKIEKFILENCAPSDMLITMGAGDVVNIGEELLMK